jgi:DNA-binding NarL/FixJ family response regulator
MIRLRSVGNMSARSQPRPAERKLRILIADDHPLIRQSVRTFLEEDPRFEVCGEATDGAIAIEETERLKPDVVVLNVVMPVLNGFEAAKAIKAKVPESVIVILSSEADERFISHARKVGAGAYVPKSRVRDGLIQAIEKALQGSDFVFVD